jgi:hypothetical protein
MHPLSLPYLIRPPTAITLDLHGVQWEAWLSQIRTDAIICDVWQYIDPAIPDHLIPAFTPPPAALPAAAAAAHHGHNPAYEDAAGPNPSNNWPTTTAHANDRIREWKIYDDKMDALRIIRAFIIWTAPVQWMIYEGVVGGGPFGDVRMLLAFLGARVRAIRDQMASQQRQQRFAGGAAARAPWGGGSNTGAAAPQGHYVFP